MMERFKLCYIVGELAFFTTQDLDKQWGDDWNDAPYEHNAGTPYEWRPGSGEQWEIRIVKFTTWEMDRPCTNFTNSPYSVETINRGAVAWLTPTGWGHPTAQPIYAGVSIGEFKRLIWLSDGTIWTSEMRPFFDADARAVLEAWADSLDENHLKAMEGPLDGTPRS